MEITYSLRLPRDAATVPLVRMICRDAMTRLGVTSGCRGDVALALTEACANVVRHADHASEYTVAMALGGHSCHIRVIDDGTGAVVEGEEFSMADPADEHGRGIAVMRLLVDEFEFDSGPRTGTVVGLRKELDLEEGSLLETLNEPSPDQPSSR